MSGIKKVTHSLRVDDETYKKLVTIRQEKDINMNKIIAMLVNNAYEDILSN